MKRKLLATVTMVFLLAAAAAAQTEHPTAILLSFVGDVVVVRSTGKTIDATYGLPLFAGDEVRTGTNAEAEIHFENGTWIQVGSNSSMQVKKPRKSSGGQKSNPKSFRSINNFLKLKNAEGTSTLAALRSVEKKPELGLVSPRQTKIRTARPAFHWISPDANEKLLLTIYNEEGIHWKQEVQGVNHLGYPDDAPPLEPGTSYSWTLETTDPLRFPPLRTNAAFFERLTDDETHELEASLERIDEEETPSKSAYHLVRASLFFDYSLIEDAIAETKQALENDPENTTLHSILARLYSEAGRTEEALEEYDQLLEKR